jgi:hypothetical protein
VIQYSLVCENGHQFDAWFKNAHAYDEQHAGNVVTCPICDSHTVDKALMAPAVSRATSEKLSLSAGHPEHAKIREMLRKVRQKVESEADYVGDKFAEEARKIHYGEVDPRGIYGEASREEVTGLLDEGVEFMPLPVLPDERN